MVPTAWDLGGGVPMCSGPQAGDLLVDEDNLPVQILILYHDFGGRWDRGSASNCLASMGPLGVWTCAVTLRQATCSYRRTISRYKWNFLAPGLTPSGTGAGASDWLLSMLRMIPPSPRQRS